MKDKPALRAKSPWLEPRATLERGEMKSIEPDDRSGGTVGYQKTGSLTARSPTPPVVRVAGLSDTGIPNKPG